MRNYFIIKFLFAKNSYVFISLYKCVYPHLTLNGMSEIIALDKRCFIKNINSPCVVTFLTTQNILIISHDINILFFLKFIEMLSNTNTCRGYFFCITNIIISYMK